MRKNLKSGKKDAFLPAPQDQGGTSYNISLDEDELTLKRLRDESEKILTELEGRRKNFGMDYYTPNKMQYEAHRSKAKTILLCAGNRSGKSMFGAMELCFHLTRKYPSWFPEERRFRHPIKAIISATEFAVVHRVIEPKLVSLLPKGYYTIKRTAQGYASRLKCGDGSTVDILTLEMKDEAYESADWDFAWEDEPQHQRKRQAIIRGLTDRMGQEVITFTPLSEPWMKEELIDRADGVKISLFTADIRDNKLDINGNPILSEEAIQRFEESLTEDIKETRMRGVFFTLRGVVYKEFSDVHIREFSYSDVEYNNLPVICVLDPHDRLPHHLIWAFVDRDDELYIDHELIVHCELPDLARKIKSVEKEKGYRLKRRLIDPNFGRKPAASGSNRSVIQELSLHGAGFYEADDDIELGHMTVRDYMHYVTSKPVTAINHPHLHFSKLGCPKTIKSVRNLQYQEWQGKLKGEKNPKEVEKDRDNHGADCIRYLAISKPKYEALTYDASEFELAQAPY